MSIKLKVLSVHTDADGNTYATVEMPEGVQIAPCHPLGVSISEAGAEMLYAVDTTHTGINNPIIDWKTRE